MTGIDSGDIQPDSVGTHELGRDYHAMKFRLEVAKHLLPTGTANGSKTQVRSDYKRKTSSIYSSKHRRRQMVAAIAGVRDSGGSRSHYLTKITRWRECIVCRLDFRDGRRGGRRRPRLTEFVCLERSLPVALCKPENGACFSRWHRVDKQ